MIPFNKPPYTGAEQTYIAEAFKSGKISGDGYFTKKCHEWFEETLGCNKALLTPSCTHALEMAAILIGIKPGDEVIMPSYTFVSTANAFVLRGARIKFVDIRPDTMNIDESKIEQAVTPLTKAIVPVHYAGVACEMDVIMDIAAKYNLFVIEDAAQGMMSRYKGKPLGTIGHIGTYSFHETKNYTSGGEGGLLILNDQSFVDRAEIIREKGTNRSQFFRGMVDKYSWVDVGSSYLPSDIQAACLWSQLEQAVSMNQSRISLWNGYYSNLKTLESKGYCELPTVPENTDFNAHMFYLKLDSLATRQELIKFLSDRDVMAVFHYVPLHSSIAGKKYAEFVGEDIHTTAESERLVRLPMYYGLSLDQVEKICDAVTSFFIEYSNVNLGSLVDA